MLLVSMLTRNFSEFQRISADEVFQSFHCVSYLLDESEFKGLNLQMSSLLL